MNVNAVGAALDISEDNMEKYNYKEAIVHDIKEYIITNEIEIDLEDDEASNWLYDELWGEDSITGNGAFFYDTEEHCSEYICSNLNLAFTACEEFGTNIPLLKIQGKNGSLARYIDCTIRCYLLGECIEQAIEELKNDSTRFNR